MKLSIITINLNNAEGLRKTIESVISQTFTDLEYIVIDGASTDGSLDIIKQYAGRINYWISEADTGIYNAMNKGIKVAKGEYVLFLNSGDWFVDQDVLCDFSSINCNSDIITGNLIILDDSGTTQLHIAPDQEQLSFNTFTRGSLPHQASFIKRTLFDKYGLYDETYKIVSDKDFFIKALIVNNCSYEHIDRVISCFPLGGVSSDIEFRGLYDRESEMVISKVTFPLVYKAYKNIQNENIQYKELFDKYRDYINLLNGKLSLVVKFILSTKLFIKRTIKFLCSK